MEDLILLKGKSADHVTSFLKRCGGGEDGTMIDGLINIVGMLNTDKAISVKNARLGGVAMGAIGTAIIGGGITLYIRHREKKQCREKMQEITEILKQEVALSDAEQLPVGDGDITEED